MYCTTMSRPSAMACPSAAAALAADARRGVAGRGHGDSSVARAHPDLACHQSIVTRTCVVAASHSVRKR
jgi:hypothetical protein